MVRRNELNHLTEFALLVQAPPHPTVPIRAPVRPPSDNLAAVVRSLRRKTTMISVKDLERKSFLIKMLRQVDALGSGHVDMIVWNLLQVTNLPHRIFKTLIDHALQKEEI